MAPENVRREIKQNVQARAKSDAVARRISRKVLHPVALQYSLLVSSPERKRGIRRGSLDYGVPPGSMMILPFDEPIVDSVRDSFPTLSFLSFPLTPGAGLNGRPILPAMLTTAYQLVAIAVSRGVIFIGLMTMRLRQIMMGAKILIIGMKTAA